MIPMTRHVAVLSAVLIGAIAIPSAAPDQIIKVDLAYGAPGNGPAPNFSPKGMQVPLTPAQSGKTGMIKVGPDAKSWIPVLATADSSHPNDLTRLYLDRNRNNNFSDDGPALEATPAQNEKTKAWWSSFNKIELSVPYPGSAKPEPYLVNFWIVREDNAPTPDMLRYSVGSWRYGTATVNGVSALIAAMDSNNDAMFDKTDYWSALSSSVPDAPKAVLSIAEARPTSRLMFLQDSGREVILEFRSFSPDGRSITFAVVDKPVTKAGDRAGDDILATERSRPRATKPFAWSHNFDDATAKAKSANLGVFIDFETTWCGPCKSMDEWIWTDSEVAGLLNAGYVGVKLDGDIEKTLVKRFNVTGYPTMIMLDATGKEVRRVVGYQSSKEIIQLLTVQKYGA
jgi:thiol-disulfide isomerase/thioredoxin